MMKYRILETDASAVENQYNTGRLLAKVLQEAHLSDEQIRELLGASSEVRTSHAECVQKACQRILLAAERQEKVFVGGDYDADGICSTAIMKRTLDLLRIPNGYYIPDRFKEGYGLSEATVRLAHEKGYSLIITVDNGVKAHPALLEARRLGMDVIVTDHHRIEEEIEADLVVHPDYMEEEYMYLCGAGVALQISRSLIGPQEELTALAAVASIGDVMPLWKETRRIVLAGMNILKRHIPRSLNAMLRPGTAVNGTSIAFQIVPKLNSVGRMNDISNVNTLVPFLLCHDENTILKYAMQLDHVNQVRRELSDRQTQLALKQLKEEAFHVIYDESFHEGICGLSAGRIAASTQRPTLVMARSGDLIKGSGRSVSGFDMFAFFSDFEETAAFGGHEQAVGLSVRAEDFDAFCAHIQEKMKTVVIDHSSEIGAIAVTPDDISLEAIMNLESVSPLPKEVNDLFAIRDIQILSIKETPKVIRYQIACANGPLEAVLFKSRNITPVQDPQTIIGRLSISRFRSNITPTIEIEEML